MTSLEEEIAKGHIKHSLKILPQYFEAVIKGRKKFELRKNDRDFNVGDIFALREWKDGEYTGRYFVGSIGYVLQNCSGYGLKDGYCIFSW